MTVTIEKRATERFGEARDLATFLNLVDHWTQGMSRFIL
ncbi:FRG domain-containing protein [Burkholderia pseudomallei]|nr:FRG domain-containing protein [Burkholderia pseudomallei]VCN38241.1 FRG domain-containing protein [Burkholderia pseudomallei]VCN49589.1 FRG domain-containing protein [Burkholderia pseudomallei]VCN64690.1 FRG domain-containing protein [Burkholderia pseudomallei]VCN69626.1 FRG domain-containing protein [Burkholderia pseudomallei]